MDDNKSRWVDLYWAQFDQWTDPRLGWIIDPSRFSRQKDPWKVVALVTKTPSWINTNKRVYLPSKETLIGTSSTGNSWAGVQSQRVNWNATRNKSVRKGGYTFYFSQEYSKNWWEKITLVRFQYTRLLSFVIVQVDYGSIGEFEIKCTGTPQYNE